MLSDGTSSFGRYNLLQHGSLGWPQSVQFNAQGYVDDVGNHEYDHPNQPFKPSWSNYGDDSHGECGIPFFYRFHPPNNDLWWSIDYGNVHFTLVSLEHDFT